jgi:acyl-CoA dehydrogenase
MAWDFSTDPEFEEHLAWMREFVRDEIWPIETIEDELDQAQLDRVNAPLQQRVKERGLWAAHLPRVLGGLGVGLLMLGFFNFLLGTFF